MPIPTRPFGPPRPERGNSNRKTVLGLSGLTVVLVAALAGFFLLLQQVFPWMTLFNGHDKAEGAPAHVAVAPVDATHGSAPVAQRVVESALSVSVPELAGNGWVENKAPTGVPGLSFGFGCDPKDGLAAVVSGTREFAQAGTMVRVSGLAYPAGGGAVAFADAANAVLGCSAASRYDLSGLGVEAMQVTSADATAAVWRRGDVLMVARVSASGRAGSLSTLGGALGRFDAALDAALAGVCADQADGVSAAVRSPYVNRKGYVGRVVNQTVPWTPPAGYTPSAAPSASVEETPEPTVPVVGDLPEVPNPMITQGPTSLPKAVPSPVAPAKPTVSPKSEVEVPRTVADPTGPGCGWTFTGQVAPSFDQAAAATAYTQAVGVAQNRMTRTWKAWEKAKAAYDTAYATYLTQVDAYSTYAARVAKVRAVWDVVNQARQEYLTALANYQNSVDALADWKKDRKQAQRTYKQAVAACAAQPGEPTQPTPTAPVASASATPTAGATPTGSVSPTATATPTKPAMVCPPVRPAILDEQPPTVPVSPVPAPQAQLPTPSPTTAASH